MGRRYPACVVQSLADILKTAVIFYKPEVARFLITTTEGLLEINAFDVVSELISTRTIAYHFTD